MRLSRMTMRRWMMAIAIVAVPLAVGAERWRQLERERDALRDRLLIKQRLINAIGPAMSAEEWRGNPQATRNWSRPRPISPDEFRKAEAAVAEARQLIEEAIKAHGKPQARSRVDDAGRDHPPATLRLP